MEKIPIISLEKIDKTPLIKMVDQPIEIKMETPIIQMQRMKLSNKL